MTATDFIRSIFKDERFDMIQLADISIDRESFVKVSSIPIGEDELLTIETTEHVMTCYASQLDMVAQVREMSRATFDRFMVDKRIDEITIHFNRSSGLGAMTVKRDDVLSWQKNPDCRLTTMIETERDIREVRWGQVASLSATKKQHRPVLAEVHR